MKRLFKFCVKLCFCVVCMLFAFKLMSWNRVDVSSERYQITFNNTEIAIPQMDWNEGDLGVNSDVAVEAVDTLAEPDFTNCYLYNTLTNNEKTAYALIYDALMTHTQTIRLNPDLADSLDVVYQAICADHGNIFWTDGYDYTYYKQDGEIIDIVFSPRYTCTVVERNEYQSIINERLSVFLSGITSDMTDYEKSKYVYDVLIQNVTYDKSVANNQNIISVFIDGATVCRGYASAAQYLFSILGIESFIVEGMANDEYHAWNAVKLDGDWYYFDVTWGNSQYETANGMVSYTDYSYLNTTEEEILKTHTIRNTFDLPKCNSNDNSYFTKENCFIDSYDEEEIGALISNCKSGDTLYLKFAEADLYDMVQNVFFVDKKIFDYCKDTSSYLYIEDTIHNVMVIKFQ